MASRRQLNHIGDTIEAGFVFRNKAKEAVDMTAVSIEITDPDGIVETIDQNDARVTLNTTLGVDLAADLDLTDAEIAARSGVVSVEVAGMKAGKWKVHAIAVAPLSGGTYTTKFRIHEKDE